MLAYCWLTFMASLGTCRTSKKRVDCKIKEAYKLGKTLGTGGKPQHASLCGCSAGRHLLGCSVMRADGVSDTQEA